MVLGGKVDETAREYIPPLGTRVGSQLVNELWHLPNQLSASCISLSI